MEAQLDLAQLINLLRQQLPILAEEYQVSSLGVFGSYIRHEQREDSDVDVLVAFDKPPSLLQFIEMEQKLTDALGVKVDLVMRDALRPTIGQRILSEVIPV
jgi:predicted nucleotidyltransferase